jgi:hypothetical protein
LLRATNELELDQRINQMRTQAQIRRFNEILRVSKFYGEKVVCDITGPDGVLMVDLEVPGVGRVRKFVSPEGVETSCKLG